MLPVDKELVLLGKISGVHGIHGWLKIYSYTDPRLKITEYDRWYLSKNNDKWSEYKLTNGKTQGKNIIAKVDTIDYRDTAENLIGAEIAIHPNQLRKIPKDEYYWRDLIGINVKTQNDELLGSIDWLFDNGSNDVIVIKNETQNKEHLIPFDFNNVIKSISIKDSLMIVDWDPDF